MLPLWNCEAYGCRSCVFDIQELTLFMLALPTEADMDTQKLLQAHVNRTKAECSLASACVSHSRADVDDVFACMYDDQGQASVHFRHMATCESVDGPFWPVGSFTERTPSMRAPRVRSSSEGAEWRGSVPQVPGTQRRASASESPAGTRSRSSLGGLRTLPISKSCRKSSCVGS